MLTAHDIKYQEAILVSSEIRPDKSLQKSVGNSEARILHYFEITVLSNANPKDTTIAIGLATKPYPSFRYVNKNISTLSYRYTKFIFEKTDVYFS